MARYHLSPKDGIPRQCSAKVKCKYANENDGAGVAHYKNKAEAEAAYEANMGREYGNTHLQASKRIMKTDSNRLGRKAMSSSSGNDLDFRDGVLRRSDGWNEVDGAPQSLYKDRKPVKSAVRISLGKRTYINEYSAARGNKAVYEVISEGSGVDGRDGSSYHRNLSDASTSAEVFDESRLLNRFSNWSKSYDVSEYNRSIVNDIMRLHYKDIKNTDDVEYYVHRNYPRDDINGEDFQEALYYAKKLLD